MIIQALCEYYDRLNDNSDIDIPRFGFSSQKIHFAIVLNRNGKLLQIRDIRDRSGKKPAPKMLNVPEPKKRTVAPVPSFMWDNTAYVLGRDNKGKPEKAEIAFSLFRDFQHQLGNSINNEGIKSVLAFLDSWNPDNTEELENWEEIAGSNLVFMIEGENQFVHEQSEVQNAWIKYKHSVASEVNSLCLVSGQSSPIARLHPDIKGVRGAQSKGASLVSFNLDSFSSYGKSQNFNAPISEIKAFAYTATLNYLLRFESRQKVQIGDATTVFWAERQTPFEEIFGVMLEPDSDEESSKKIRLFLEAMREGKNPLSPDEKEFEFYILGLSPNASRLSVRFWFVSTVGEMSEKINQHFSDLAIDRSYENEPSHPSIWQLLKETAVLSKTDNIPPKLAGEFARSIFTGSQYPVSLLSAVLNRMRADGTVNYLRASLIKAYLVRRNRLNNNTNMEINMSLDEKSTNVAYRLGRLFAALEKAQKDAVPGAKATIKDRYFSSASATPRVVFPQLMRLVQHHISKAEWGHVSDKRIEEITQGINEFPAHLNLEDQGLFALGYYHQKNALFKKKENNKEEQS